MQAVFARDLANRSTRAQGQFNETALFGGLPAATPSDLPCSFCSCHENLTIDGEYVSSIIVKDRPARKTVLNGRLRLKDVSAVSPRGFAHQTVV
jgi:hypothetical protein